VTPRLASATLVTAIIRLTQSAGGFATVLRKGDEGAGAIILQTLEKGGFSGLWERLPDAKNSRTWQRIGPQCIENAEELAAYLDRRTRSDSDIWLIELDIANAERFVVESVPTG
jgi:hypothetical protein